MATVAKRKAGVNEKRPAYSGSEAPSRTTPSTYSPTSRAGPSVPSRGCRAQPERAMSPSAFRPCSAPGSIGEPGGLPPAARRVELQELLLALFFARSSLTASGPAVSGP